MISYYTKVYVNDNFNEQILFQIFLEWLQTTRNKMTGLKFTGELPLHYEVSKKQLHIEKFDSLNIYSIQFITSDNRKNTQIVIEIHYDEDEMSLEMMMREQLTQNTTQLPALSIPVVFKMLLRSEYIYHDYSLKISDTYHLLRNNEFYYLQLEKYKLPIVVLRKNKRCLIAPNVVAKHLYGLAHVVCIHTKKEPVIQIFYPNQRKQNVDFTHEKETINHIQESVVQYHLQHLKSHTYMSLTKEKLNEEHLIVEQFQLESLQEYEAKLKEVEQNYAELVELYEGLLTEQEALYEAKLELEKMNQKYEKQPILLSSGKDEHREEALVLSILKKEVTNLTNEQTYRRKDILESILKECEIDENKD